jgi:hypothetical protein
MRWGADAEKDLHMVDGVGRVDGAVDTNDGLIPPEPETIYTPAASLQPL